VRQHQVRRLQRQVIIGEEIDVDGPRTPPLLMAALAPERPLHGLCAREQLMRGQSGFELQAGIDERRLILDAPRRCAIIRGAREQPYVALAAQHCHCSTERSAHIAHIAAEPDQCLRHGPSARA
jgi:hypothetical protein